MTPSALKKLIAIFLLAASTVGSAALIAPAFLALTTPSAALTPEDRAQNNPTQNGNAFVEAIPPQTEGTGSALDAPASPLPSDNLTMQAARALAQSILAQNPQGPIAGAGGTPVVQTPDIDALVDKFINDPAVVAEIVAENIEPNISAKDVKRIITGPTPRDNTDYLLGLGKVLRTHVMNDEFSRLTDGDLSPETLNAMRLAVAQAKKELERLPVPTKLVRLHLATLQMLKTWERLSSFNPESNDPLKDSIAVELRFTDSEKVADVFQAEFERLRFRVQTSGTEDEQTKALSDLQRLFGIKEAHAISFPADADAVDIDSLKAAAEGVIGLGQLLAVPTSDIVANTRKGTVSNIADVAKSFWQKLKEWLLATIRDRLVHVMIQQTIQWIQGGGTPQFVTDWKGFLQGVGNVAVGDFLYELSPRLCQSFGPLVTAFLQPTALSARAVTCTLDQVVQNVQAFYDNFQNGGWVAYAAAIEPRNNPFGAIYLSLLISEQRREQAAEAARNDALAGQGTRSTQRCVRPFDKYRRCLDDVLEQCSRVGPPSPQCIADGNAQCAQYQGQQGCEPGGLVNTTPGSIVTSLTAQALGTPFQQLVNANDFTALVNAVTNAIITRLIGLGNRGLAGLTFPNDTCRGLTGLAYDRCVVEKACRDAGLTGARLQDCLGRRPNPPNVSSTTPTSTPTSTDACAQENCGRNDNTGQNCLCKAQDGITTDDFCFLGDVSDAQARVEEAFRNGATNTGLIDGPFGGCNNAICVQDAEAYKLAVKAEVERANPNVTVFITDEVCVVGTCNKNTCTNPATSLCPDTSRNPPGYCVAPGQRTECTKIDSSFNTIRYNVPNGICPGNAQ